MPMKNTYFILGIHNHQPIGNFDYVLADAFKKAYWPFLNLLFEHPSIKVCFHYSGILWEWIRSRAPQMLDLFKELLSRGQIELLSGGFYEPILSIIPDEDKIGQMKMMGAFINKEFGMNPKGIWLTERVWEPSIPKFINDAGYEYVILDDLHFLASGLEEKDLHGFYFTEDQGKMVKVFPGSKKLRYLIPFRSPEETLEYLCRIGKDSDAGNLAIMADDGEKFGIWPGTYKWVYEQGWLHKFFTLLEKNRDWLHMCTFTEYISEHNSLGQVYLPTASYSEMEEWALPYKTQTIFHSLLERINKDGFSAGCINFVRGGLWRNFLCKYKEGNIIYNRMLQISYRIDNLKKDLFKPEEKKLLPDWLLEAQKALWKGQCNDAYWHGLFGGLYLPHLRAALYQNLIHADNLIESNQHPLDEWNDWEKRDMDQDGIDEIKINTDKYCLFIDVDSGGSIYEWDFRPKCINVINTLMRRPEGYHQKILNLSEKEIVADQKVVKSIHDIQNLRQEGLEKLLIYDKYSRNCLLDHFFHPSMTLEDFTSSQYVELGNFINKPYQANIAKDNKSLNIALSREGRINSFGEIAVSKTLKLFSGETVIKITYDIINKTKTLLDTICAIEWNFNLLSGYSDDRYFLIDDEKPSIPYLASKAEEKDIQKVCLIDNAIGIEIGIKTSKKFDLWRFPIETASNSENGFEKVYQSSTILLRFPLVLRGMEGKTIDLDCWIKE